MLEDNTNTMGRYNMLMSASFHPPRDVYFPLNIQSEASLNAMCLFSAAQLASYGSFPAERARYYQLLAVQTVRQKLLDGGTQRRFSDPLMMAVANLIASDKEVKPEVLLTHFSISQVASLIPFHLGSN